MQYSRESRNTRSADMRPETTSADECKPISTKRKHERKMNMDRIAYIIQNLIGSKKTSTHQSVEEDGRAHIYDIEKESVN